MNSHSPRALLFVACAVLGVRAIALEASDDPRETLRLATDEVMTVIYGQPAADGRALAERAQPVMEKFFDFSAMTRRAVGPGWRGFTLEQQAQATRLLTALVVRNYCSHFDLKVRSRVTFAAVVPLADGRCELPTSVIYSNQTYSVTYRAEKISGRWHFYDVIVEGVSLVANYRAQFTALSQQGGAEAIVHALEEKLAGSPSQP